MSGRKKRKRESSEERVQRKIKKYEQKMEKLRSRQWTPSPAPTQQSILLDDDAAETSPSSHHNEENNVMVEINEENTEDVLDEEIINILGDAPDELSYGPPIHKELALRWTNAIKNGLLKEKKKEIMKKYLPPENCKTIDAPKLNLEAQAAVSEAAVKRDKAIASKQSQIGSALTALAMAFEQLSKNGKENISVINYVSDAARLLCDHQNQESNMRRNFILQGLEQTTRDSVKDTEIDQWLFGESFAEKLKASKAIKKSGQEISLNKSKKSQQQTQRKPLNYKGPVMNQYRGQRLHTGPQRYYQNKKPRAQLPALQKMQSRAPPRSTNNRN
ncbi:unnamed protein product [Euphydryas editha]|uniref:Uncharacterized protein n=1 Tax=Euphydryas editha TaxID=104508 RepID=A0AAU9TVU9_EUPED|nr:unnamed protein product [Euphydryas editha]CAH2089943.1 unnamed protein product [Euphydryas editha]